MQSGNREGGARMGLHEDTLDKINQAINRLHELDPHAAHSLQAVITTPERIKVDQLGYLYDVANRLIDALERLAEK
jgi:hypothetical protein